MAAPPRMGYVYVVQEGKRRSSVAARWRESSSGVMRSGLVKIGFTSKPPSQRFYDLARVTRREVTVLAVFRGTSADERRLHDALSTFRAKTRLGTEWFHPSSKLQFLVDGYRMGCLP